MLSLLLALAAPEFAASPFYFFDLDENLTANVALADVDRDGDLDVLTANGRHWAQQDYVFINHGNGRLLEARRVGAGLTTGYALLPIDLDNDSELDELIRNRADTVYHPVGTCRMGADDDSVVDTKLKARGVDGLWIADASLMPKIVSGNTNAPSIMIGERCADFVKVATV